MKNNKLTYVQFYKANKQRRQVLANRFGYKDPNALMAFLFKNDSITNTTFKTYAEFNSYDKATQLKIANQEGYKTISAYKSRLRSEFKVKPVATPVKGTVKASSTVNVVNTQPQTITSIFILDESGSMAGAKAQAMFKGVHESLRELKAHAKTEPNTTFNVGVVGFSNKHDSLHIGNIQYFNYTKTRIRDGWTALHDAVGYVLTELLNNNTLGKTVVQIFTDGGENGSHKFSSHQVARLIQNAEKEGITVTFMGTSGDVRNVKQMYSLKDGNTLVHQNTADSIGQTFRMSSLATVAYSKSVVAGEDVSSNFYSKVLVNETK